MWKQKWWRSSTALQNITCRIALNIDSIVCSCVSTQKGTILKAIVVDFLNLLNRKSYRHFFFLVRPHTYLCIRNTHRYLRITIIHSLFNLGFFCNLLGNNFPTAQGWDTQKSGLATCKVDRVGWLMDEEVKYARSHIFALSYSLMACTGTAYLMNILFYSYKNT